MTEQANVGAHEHDWLWLREEVGLTSLRLWPGRRVFWCVCKRCGAESLQPLSSDILRI